MKELWKLKTYRHWFIADSSEVLARSLRTFVIPLVAFAVSGSESVTGAIVALASTIALCLQPFGGVLADRHNRRSMMIALGVAGTVLSVALAVCLGLNALTTAVFVAFIVAFGVCSGLLGAANDAILRSLIPLNHYPKAQAVRESREACVELSSGVIGGFLYQIAGWLAIAVSGALYAWSAFASRCLPRSNGRATPGDDKVDVDPKPEPRAETGAGIGSTANGGAEAESEMSDGAEDEAKSGSDIAPRESFLQSLVSGWRWSFGKTRFLWLVCMSALINVAFVIMITGAQISLVAQGVSPVLIGLLDTGMGLSTLVGSLIAVRLSDAFATGRLLICVLGYIALCFVPMMFSSQYLVILVFLTAMGLPLPALNAALFGFIYSKVPDELQGRASSVFETSIGLLAALAPGLAGVLLAGGMGLTGLAAVAVVLAVLSVLTVALTSLRHIPKPERWEECGL